LRKKRRRKRRESEEEGEEKEAEEEEGRFWVLRCRIREGKLVLTGSGPRFQPEISRI
jgi:hypothetical protein